MTILIRELDTGQLTRLVLRNLVIITFIKTYGGIIFFVYHADDVYADDPDDPDDEADDVDDDVCSLGVLELWPACQRDVQWLPSGEILQSFLPTQGLGGTCSGLSARWFFSSPRVWARPRPLPPAGQQTSWGGRALGLTSQQSALSDLFFHCNLLS